MASVVDDPGGRRRVQFLAPDGKKKTLRLGKVDRRTADAVARHVEALLAARISGQVTPRETATWLAGIGDQLRDRLAAVGLVEERTAAPMLGAWCRDYIAGRSDLAPRSVARLEYAAQLLAEHFGAGRHLDSINAGDAERYARWLGGTKGFGANTVRRQTGWAKQFLGAAVKHELVVRNPFASLAANTRPDRTRDHFITRAEAAKVIDACPDAEWRLIVALCRFAGLRCPSEVLALRWGDVLWDRDRLNVPNVKTGKTTGATFRTIPLFPEVRVHLEAVFDRAEEGTEYVISRYRGGNANLRTQLGRIARKAGVVLWDKPFVNMRASCATELAQSYPAYVATAWLGHTQAIAEAHYWQVTEDHFKKATQNPTQSVRAAGCHEVTGKSSAWPNGMGDNNLQHLSTSCNSIQYTRQESNNTRNLFGNPPSGDRATQNPTHTPSDPDLTLILDHWHALPPAVRAGVVALVRASLGGAEEKGRR